MTAGRGAAIHLAVILAVGLGPVCGAQALTEPIAVSGDYAPDCGGLELGIMWGSPWLNESGQVAFSCDLYDPYMMGPAGWGVFRYEGPSAGTLIARSGLPAPGGGTFSTAGAMIRPCALNQTGQVAFWSDVMDMMPTTGLFRGDGATTVSLVRTNDPTPPPLTGTFSMFDSMGSPAFNDLGQAAFRADVLVPASVQGVFRADGTAVDAIALAGDPAPAPGGGTDGTFMMFNQVRLNNLGQAAFQADTMGGISFGMGGVYRSDGATAVSIVRDGQAAPLPSGETFMGMYESLSLNQAGQVAFRANLVGGVAMWGLFRGDGATITPLAVEFQGVPGGNGVFSMFNGLTLNDAGQVAFGAMLTGTASPGFDDECVYRADGVTIDEIARKGDPAPDGNGVFGMLSVVDVPRINGGGQVAFVADLTGTANPGVDNRGIYLADDQEVVQVARKGDDHGLGTIMEVGFSGMGAPMAGDILPTVVNDFGQVVYSVTYDDMTGPHYGVIRYTPDLHWRSGAGGSWDDSDNWTVGLEPAYVHPVIIDPDVNLTVTGPAAARTIASLDIAPRAGAAAGLLLGAGGDLNVLSLIIVEDGGTLELQNGTLTAPQMHLNDGGTYQGSGGTLNVNMISQDGGTVEGTLQNQGTFTYLSGAFNGRLLNQGSVQFSAPDFTAGDGMRNEAVLWLSGMTITLNGSGLDNRSTLTFLGGCTLAGDGPLVNNGTMEACGLGILTIAGTGGFVNNGYFTNQGTSDAFNQMDVVLANTGPNANAGNMDLATGRLFTLDGADLANTGTVNVGGGIITGTGWLNNLAGGTVAGRGIISSGFTNQGLVVVDAGTLCLVDPFLNEGAVRLAAASANLTGGKVTNAGTLEGHGQVASDVDNFGTIEPVGGVLSLSGALENMPGALITATAGNKVLVTGGLPANDGIISLAGGTFDNNGQALANAGLIAGYGVLRTGGLSNMASVVLSGGTATVNGPVVNEAGGRIEVAYQPAVFSGNVVNYGEFKVTDTSVTFAGTYTENGVYNSDPASSYFRDLSVGAGGALVGGTGDRFLVRGNFLSESAAATAWNTVDADLVFQASTSGQHTMGVTGEDRGAVAAGWAGNFAWGSVAVQAGQTVTLADGNATPGGALYARSLTLASGATLGLGDLNLHVKELANAGTLDLTTSNLVVDYDVASPFAEILGWVASGFRDGPNHYWDGPGIHSSTAAAAPLTAVGVIDNQDTEAGIGGLTELEGQPVDATAVLVKYTWWGDANLDGLVNSNDYDRIDANWLFYGNGQGTPPGGFRWAVGDFNYDGLINSNDYDKIDAAWLLSGGAALGGGTPVPTPEPATLALVALGGLALAARRRG